MTVDHATQNAKGMSMRPDVNALAPSTPWNSCGRRKLAGINAIACKVLLRQPPVKRQKVP